MHHGFAEIRDAAEGLGDGWSRATITVSKGDTILTPGTTKKLLTARGDNCTATYLLAPEGIAEVEELLGEFTLHYLSDEERRGQLA